ncbi:MAG: hypothetical protein QM730_18360 [Anaerolineales bacterium]
MSELQGFFWFIVMLIPLILLQRMLHREIQAMFLIITRSPQLTMGIFSFIFLPGVFLHELSYFLMAKILRVPTGRFSIFPQPLPDGRLQLGYVETAKADIVRDFADRRCSPHHWYTLRRLRLALSIGHAHPMGNAQEWTTEFVLDGDQCLTHASDFYLWFYLTFVVSSTMMPSESDRHAWLELVVSVGVIFGITLLIGAGPWMLNNVAPLLSCFLSTVGGDLRLELCGPCGVGLASGTYP